MSHSISSNSIERPVRSALYIPGSNERALNKAAGLACDVIIFDLEDAVLPSEKLNARKTLANALKCNDYGHRLKIVRVNGLDTPWGAEDVTAFAEADIDGILLPKVETSNMLEELSVMCPKVMLWAMMETPLGMLNAASIAAHPKLAGLVMGTNDLAKELKARFRQDRLPMMGGLQLSVLAARAHGLLILDGVYNAFKDVDGLIAECEQGRDMGFDGKTVIHPNQIAVANTTFSPSEAEIILAKRHIAAFAEAQSQGAGIAVVDGQIVENLHVEVARGILAKVEYIAAKLT